MQTYDAIPQLLYWNVSAYLQQQSPAFVKYYSFSDESSSWRENHSSQELVLDLQLLVIWLVI
jgi:hypothetical protein